MGDENDPQLQWALEVLNYNPYFERTFLAKYQPMFVCAVMGMVSVTWLNKFFGLPKYYRPRRMIWRALGGMAIGYYLMHTKYQLDANVDLSMKEYILKHPERFRKRQVVWSEIFEPWLPIR